MVNPVYDLNPSIGLTANESHGLRNVTGSLDRSRTGLAAEIVVVPNGGESGPRVKEFPSQSADIEFGGDHDVMDQMD